MRILFVMQKPSFARHFESMLEALVARGHHVHVAVDEIRRSRVESVEDIRRRGPTDELLERLCERNHAISTGPAPVRDDRWTELAYSLRRGIDYLRVLAPAYANAPKLRARLASRTPALVQRLTRRGPLRSRIGLRLVDRVLRALDRAIPDGDQILQFLGEQDPDLVLLTPGIKVRQTDYLRASRSLGLRSALCVASWDNLTNKGLVQEAPDRVLLWNDDQRREAVEMHRLPAERITATGAPIFDQWFDRSPREDAAEFRWRLGFDRDRPIVLYTCSFHFIAPEEPRFVARWLDALRAHPDERLRTANVLIRPYPRSGVDWESQPAVRSPGVSVWPAAGAFPTGEDSKAGYYDSLFHSSAVVGINTSALIEASIVGRRAFTVLDPDFRDTQEGTLHFHYLMRDNGGPLTVGQDLGQHLDQLAKGLAQTGDDEHARRFVARFVRPHGLDRPALPFLVAAIEDQASAPSPKPHSRRIRRAIGRVALAPAARAALRRGRRSRPKAKSRGRRTVSAR